MSEANKNRVAEGLAKAYWQGRFYGHLDTEPRVRTAIVDAAARASVQPFLPTAARLLGDIDPPGEDDHYRDCNDTDECGWTGLYSECKYLGGISPIIGPLCPECGETTEAADGR